MDLLLGGIEAEVADVERCGVGELVFDVGGGRTVVGVVVVAVVTLALFVLRGWVSIR